MKTKNWLVLLASCVALAAAPVMGCGGDDDPSGNGNNVENNDTPDGGNGTPDGGNGTPDGGNGTPDGGNGTPDGGNGTPDGGNGTPDGGNGTPDGGNGTPDGGNGTPDGGGTGACAANDWWTGQAYSGGTGVHSGGTAVEALTTPLADANLQAVVEAMPVTTTETATNPDTNETYERLAISTADVSIEVTGAMVLATGYDNNHTDYDDANGWFWLQDANATMLVYKVFDETNQPENPVRVGDTVSFTATELTNYKGTPEITKITGFSVVEPTSEQTEVPFTDFTGEDIDVLAEYGKLVRVSGEITATSGECGGAFKCYTLSHGTKNIELRTNSNYVGVGTCATFFGPLSSTPAVLVPDAELKPQLNVETYDWLKTPREN